MLYLDPRYPPDEAPEDWDSDDEEEDQSQF